MAELPILYSFRRCPYAMRARLAIDASAIVCELREITLRDKPADMLRASPKATVPVLVDEAGFVIDESFEIMLWALRRNDPENWLKPERGDADEMLSLIERFDTEFKGHLDRYKYPGRFADADPAFSRSEASRKLMELENRLQGARFLFGTHATLADMAIAPFVRQFANVDVAWFENQSWTQLGGWLAAIVNSPRFVRIMRPLKPWVPGTRGVQFPFVTE
jgi:glutathione S-transferase